MGSSLMLVALLGLVGAALGAKATYDEAFARHKMFPVTAAAYSDTPEKCLAATFKSYQLIRKVIMPCDTANDTCGAFAAVNHDDKAIMLSFRGTHGFEQLVVEITHMAMDGLLPFVGGGKVGNYFKATFEVMWNNGILDAFNSARKQYPGYELWITGHSLGGSMASLAALYAAHVTLFDSSKIKLMTFGQPRTGDKDYAAAVDYNIPYSFRVIHNHDIVPHIPLVPMGYNHHEEEVYYPNQMTPGSKFQECAGDENKKCSDGNIDASIEDHLHYFNQEVSGYGYAGCSTPVKAAANRLPTPEQAAIQKEFANIMRFDKHHRAVVKGH